MKSLEQRASGGEEQAAQLQRELDKSSAHVKVLEQHLEAARSQQVSDDSVLEGATADCDLGGRNCRRSSAEAFHPYCNLGSGHA